MVENSFDTARVRVRQGILQGTVENGIKIFRGVPYAAPPLGEKRWRAPEPPARWFGVRPADRMVGGALQPDGRAHFPYEDFELSAKMDSEDCLYLNIYTPAVSQDEKLPILVWLHGGGMVAGTGMAPFFEGEVLASKGIIVVNINYRLGLFGFLCHPELSAEAPYGTSGNYALLDMRQALVWLRENAAQFGGDPERITVGGQSGGSVGASCQLMSPLTEGLCARIILDSGCPSIGGMMDPKTLSEAEREGEEFARSLGNLTIAQLRGMDGCDLLEASLKEHFTPNYCIDGYFLKDDPQVLLGEGIFNRMDVLAGFTTEEFGSFRIPDDVCIEPDKFELYVRTVFEDAGIAQKVIASYPHADSAGALKSLLRLQGDLMFLSAVRLGEAAAGKGTAAWIYSKSRPDPGEKGEKFGSTHSSELPYLFGRPDPCIINPAGMDEAEREFGEQLMSYWVNFVKTGCPNGPGTRVKWPVCTVPFRCLDLGKVISPKTADDCPMIAAFDDMLKKRGQRTTKPYMDFSPLGYPGLFRPV